MLATTNNQNRRHDIDSLRVIAFFVLIFYHIGMYYVADWDWHIKSGSVSYVLQDIMVLTSPWRMSLMFFISAVALGLVIKRFNRLLLLNTRTLRILLPLIFGMYFIVAPQPYIEFLSNKLITGDYWHFWLEYINPHTQLLTEKQSGIGLLTWNHLWFLPYLWIYSVIIVALAKPLISLSQAKLLSRLPLIVMVFSVVIVLALIRLWLGERFPTTHDLINDWYNHGKYGFVFIVGFIFALQKSWWQGVIQYRKQFMLVALCTYAFFIAERHSAFPELAEAFQTDISVKVFYRVIASINHWCWLFAAIGFAGYWLNKPSRFVTYANNAVLPWYILHQTLIIVFAWWLKALALPPRIEVPLLITLTVIGCLLGYEVIKRVPLLNQLFGVKAFKIQNLNSPVKISQTPNNVARTGVKA